MNKRCVEVWWRYREWRKKIQDFQQTCRNMALKKVLPEDRNLITDTVITSNPKSKTELRVATAVLFFFQRGVIVVIYDKGGRTPVLIYVSRKSIGRLCCCT
jgi:hypothetical protein